MADKNETLKLIRMNEVEATEIDWLWYPYIPYGKITVVQGDSGGGKTTVVLAIAAAVTTGAVLPESKTAAEPMSVIFQTAEDGLGDTVMKTKPRSRPDSSGHSCSTGSLLTRNRLTSVGHCFSGDRRYIKFFINGRG